MIVGEKKTIGPGTEFLDEALVLAREVVALRCRLTFAKREHGELLVQRGERLAEGWDVLP